jgi:predicted dehydrogenase
MRRGRGANAVEDAMLVALECGDVSLAFDVAWDYVGEEERTWFEIIGTAGSARLGPLRVTKRLNGRAVDVSPAARRRARARSCSRTAPSWRTSRRCSAASRRTCRRPTRCR